MIALLVSMLLALVGSPVSMHAQSRGPSEMSSRTPLEARIWLDRGVDPVLQTGDQARVYYRASEDSYVAVLQINTDGRIRMLLPGRSEQMTLTRGGGDYRVMFSGVDHWIVEEAPGTGYFYIIASPVPVDLGRLATDVSVGSGTDATELFRVTQDPHLAVQSVVDAVLPEDVRDGFALDFTVYHVGQSYSYPRFMCYDCHTAESFDVWNPYRRTCPDVRVVIFSDPYYYPSTRYQGGRVLYPRPVSPIRPQFGFKERGPGEPGTPLVQVRSAPDGHDPEGVGSLGGRDDATDPSDALLRQLTSEPGAGSGAIQVDGTRGPGAPPVFGPSMRQDAGPSNPDRPVLRRRAVQDGDAGSNRDR